MREKSVQMQNENYRDMIMMILPANVLKSSKAN